MIITESIVLHIQDGRQHKELSELRLKNKPPAWADLKAVEQKYTDAQWMFDVTGVKHEVDHIVPLQSKIVCGLHNDFNLQVLPVTLNRQKSNKYWPDMPVEVRV